LSLKEWIEKLINGEREPKQAGCKGNCGEPILLRMRRNRGGYDLEQLSIIVHGLITGMIGNVQAGVSIAISEWFNMRDAHGMPLLIEAQRAAATGNDSKLGRMLMEALTRNPPAAFLPRLADGRGCNGRKTSVTPCRFQRCRARARYRCLAATRPRVRRRGRRRGLPASASVSGSSIRCCSMQSRGCCCYPELRSGSIRTPASRVRSSSTGG
jgi:hypothetical protein